jgi:hypothetical protein
MNSHPVGDLTPIGPHTSGDRLTEEQRAFAIAIGRILAEQWEQLRRPATGGASPPSAQAHPKGHSSRGTPSDDH